MKKLLKIPKSLCGKILYPVVNIEASNNKYLAYFLIVIFKKNLNYSLTKNGKIDYSK